MPRHKFEKLSYPDVAWSKLPGNRGENTSLFNILTMAKKPASCWSLARSSFVSSTGEVIIGLILTINTIRANDLFLTSLILSLNPIYILILFLYPIFSFLIYLSSFFLTNHIFELKFTLIPKMLQYITDN